MFYPVPKVTTAHGARWSIEVRDVAESRPVWSREDGAALLSTASVAKVFLLAEVAARIEAGTLDERRPVNRHGVEPVGGSGLWQHLHAVAFPVGDAARLVGTVSDNLATNALLGHVGLDAVQARAAALAPRGSTMCDRVRNERGPEVPARFSVGCASDYVAVFTRLHAGAVAGDAGAARVLDWLDGNTDASLVTAGLGVDPLTHTDARAGLQVVSKTGSDTGVRAEAGIVTGPARTVAFAAICNWDPDLDVQGVGDVVASMRALGYAVARYATSATS